MHVNEKRFEKIMGDVIELLPLINKKFLREDELFKSEKLFPSHIQILMALSKNKQMTMTEISKQINVINSNLTPLVDKLIREGYLKRQTSKKDRRVVYISITTQGKQFVNQHKAYVIELLSERFDMLDEQQLEALEEHISGLLSLIEFAMKPQE